MTDRKGEKKRAKLYGIRNSVNNAEVEEQLGGVSNLVREKHNEESCTSVLSDSLSQSSSTMPSISGSQNKVIVPERIVLTAKRRQRTASAMDKHVTLERTIKSDLSTVPQRETSSSTQKVTYTNEAESINNKICGQTDSVNTLTNITAHVAPTSSGNETVDELLDDIMGLIRNDERPERYLPEKFNSGNETLEELLESVMEAIAAVNAPESTITSPDKLEV